MSTIVQSIKAEYLRYKTLAEGAIDQLEDDDLSREGPNGGNSIAVICWHVSGNLKSRFTDFLTSDGEKPWRQREEEFRARTVSRTELQQKWEDGWKALLDALSGLTDDDLKKTVTIRQQPLLVQEALHRSLSHISYHVGQIVYVAKGFRAAEWNYLSIAPGQSDSYNKAPKYDKPAAQQAMVASRITRK
jgi:uncharacterized damage-inducible protein DinB